MLFEVELLSYIDHKAADDYDAFTEVSDKLINNIDEVGGCCLEGWWDRECCSQAPKYPWQPSEWQQPSGNVALIENSVEMNWYLP